MDVVGVKAAYLPVILAKHCKKTPEDASLVIRNMSEQF